MPAGNCIRVIAQLAGRAEFGKRLGTEMRVYLGPSVLFEDLQNMFSRMLH